MRPAGAPTLIEVYVVDGTEAEQIENAEAIADAAGCLDRTVARVPFMDDALPHRLVLPISRACPDAPICQTCPCAADDDVCLPHERPEWIGSDPVSRLKVYVGSALLFGLAAFILGVTGQ